MGRAARIKQKATLARQSDRVPELFERALDALRSNNHAAATVHLRQILLQDPDHRPALFRLAMSLREQGAHDEAIPLFERAIALAPLDVDAIVNLAEALRRARRLPEAEACCDRAVALAPGHAEAYLIRAVVRHDRGSVDASIADLRSCVALDAKVTLAHNMLAKMIIAKDRHAEAYGILQAAFAAEAADFETYRLQGDVCEALGMIGQGFSAYREAIERNPQDGYSYVNLTGLLCRTSLIEVALQVADVGIKIAPGLMGLHYNRGIALEKLHRYDEALLAYGEALRLEPDSGRTLISICRLRSEICDWDGLDVSQGLARTLTYRKGRKTAPFAILPIVPSLADVLTCNRVWSRALDLGRAPLAPYAPRPVERRGERLRIGYLSADFHEHATSALIAEMLELHDRTRVETFGYSIGAPDTGAMRSRVARALEHFHDIADFSHDAAAALIRQHEIDVLVDLKGYTFQARPEILVRRPAPVQVAYLGYPSTMGARFIDYVLGDPIVTPMAHAPYYTEQIVQLPNSYQPNDRNRPVAAHLPSRADCGLPPDAFVFCCFNANYKITPKVFDVWMRLLKQVPDSVLWLYEANASVAPNLRREAEKRGIDASRLVFAPKRPPADHIARMKLGDLFLDTTPYGAHTTASEALWVGLPVLTYCGEGFAARVGASLVTAVGIPELVVDSLEAYERKALELVANPTVLRAIRSRLETNVAATPLFDSPRFTRDVETAYEMMTAIRDAGEMPRAFAVPS